MNKFKPGMRVRVYGGIPWMGPYKLLDGKKATVAQSGVEFVEFPNCVPVLFDEPHGDIKTNERIWVHHKQCRRLVKKKHGKVVSFVKIDDVECGPETTQTFFLPKGVKTIRVGPLIGRHLELGYEVENEPL